ncbi:hypothetical protein J4401_03450 [Candidatus Woesearchaeota archaeon]|nr:hypothetical protein [Candidatus Woesearchaeota archaeon]
MIPEKEDMKAASKEFYALIKSSNIDWKPRLVYAYMRGCVKTYEWVKKNLSEEVQLLNQTGNEGDYVEHAGALLREQALSNFAWAQIRKDSIFDPDGDASRGEIYQGIKGATFLGKGMGGFLAVYRYGFEPKMVQHLSWERNISENTQQVAKILNDLEKENHNDQHHHFLFDHHKSFIRNDLIRIAGYYDKKGKNIISAFVLEQAKFFK